MPTLANAALQDLVSLLGCPAAGNPAQYLFERAFAAAGLDWRFLSLEVAPDRLGDALAGVSALGFRGCILAGPLRRQALPLMGQSSPSASFAGAASLVHTGPEGLLVGHMTDGRGVLAALRMHAEISAEHVFVLGAGAVGRAAALELSLAGAKEILVANRSPERAAALVDDLNAMGRVQAAVIPWHTVIDIPERVRVVVAAIPAAGGRTAPDLRGLRGDQVVVDTAVASGPTAVTLAAARAGACVVDGLEVHCHRTAIDFQAWTGLEADIDLLREALDEFLDA
ncbi:MAG: shikimate dehydrogenase family protein [Pirellulales bacterium]